MITGTLLVAAGLLGSSAMREEPQPEPERVTRACALINGRWTYTEPEPAPVQGPPPAPRRVVLSTAHRVPRSAPSPFQP